MTRPWLAGLIACAVVAIILANSVFILDQRHQAVVVNFEGPVRVINPVGADDPGLQVKAPFAQSVVRLDKRVQAIETGPEPVVTADRQALRVDASVGFRIVDALAFWRTLGDEASAPERLEPLVDATLRRTFARSTAADIIAGRPPTLMAAALADLRARAASARLGIDVVDLRIRRVTLPAESAAKVYQRMTANLQQQAAQVRARSAASRQDILAAADNQANVILAKANEQASAVRGAGDAQAAQLYAAAYGKDPRFAAFYRSMRAYRKALARKDATLVLSPDTDFFKYLRQGARAK